MSQTAAMCDLHTHTFLSDGELGPAELLVRAEAVGISLIAVTDHVDWGTVDIVVPAIVKACSSECSSGRLLAVPGAEITHVRPSQIAALVERCRQLGAKVVLVHGQTTVEPVPEGTNRAAIEAGVDVLAHPGLISEEDVARAAELGVRLEISGRHGHSLTNGHVARLASAAGTAMTFGSDAHSPGDLRGHQSALTVLRGSGLDAPAAQCVLDNNQQLLCARAGG
jgi:histidinol phosphatase-like PHP family hydrolase